ncbi:exopolysaccharide biosynthesis protein [Paenibacillus sp. 32O-W]|uniref:phosphodiester glycosidase family protein n=1 Tax=Paenibacillus sp. 32O-W TaxID=1695218 RepID=UPI00072277D8|nr:phosphodiester glycosidase family protein [Paenibacillus sp. 32O-W]ALS26469.1 exopolysaccharide biosynthesis protein [Paenibacillus sp. 32O-W]
MRLTVKSLNRFVLLACAPFIGAMLWIASADIRFALSADAYPAPPDLPPFMAAGQADRIASKLEQAYEIARQTAASMQKTVELYNKTNAEVRQVVRVSAGLAGKPAAIYDRRITRKLGTPVQTVQSDKITAQLFYLKTHHFQSYALKVKLKSPEAMTMVLGEDRFGGAETTLSAAQRYNAVAGVNAGGFADRKGVRYPLGTTIVDGEYANGFHPSEKDLFVVGMNEEMQLVGGKFFRKEQLDKLNLRFGASFVPMLMKNGSALAIPPKWQTSPKRAPRTVIANYKDGQLLFLVADGYSEDGRSGATLREMQILLKRFGAVDAYNLDGGGSSSLVFNGRVVNRPSDGQLRKLPTHFLFFA